jgi:uncharacterized membrane protein
MIARIVDQTISGLLLAVGILHVAAGSSVVLHPTDRGTWFISAGFLGITAGLANWARARTAAPSRLLALAALCGAAGVVVIGGLIAVQNPKALSTAPSLIVFAIAMSAAAFSAGDLIRGTRR